MKAKLIAIAVLAALTTALVGPAVARDPWRPPAEWRQQKERQRAWEHERNRDRARDRSRGMERQRQRDIEKDQYWRERDLEYKMGTPPPRR